MKALQKIFSVAMAKVSGTSFACKVHDDLTKYLGGTSHRCYELLLDCPW